MCIRDRCDELGVGWGNRQELLRAIFRGLLDNEEYQEYMATEERGFQVDRESLVRMFRKHMVNFEMFQDMLEEESIYWVDDLDLAASMVIKTIKTIKEGDGPSPAATDTVTVNYKGTLIDGKEFDSGNGISFPLNGVIKGWTEGLQVMKAGGSTRFFIPSDLAYGPSGPPNIGPNSTLIFDVDLLSIKGKEQASANPATPAAPVDPAPKQVVTSDIIKVPSAEEMKKGAKIEVIKKEDLPAEIEKAKQKDKEQPAPEAEEKK